MGLRLLTSMARLSRHMLTSFVQVIISIFEDIINDCLLQCFLVPLRCKDKVGLTIDDMPAMAFWVPITSMVMIAPLISTSLKSSGIAMISFDFSAQATCPGDMPNSPGTDRLKVTHPDRLKVTHLVPEDGRSGQERQPGSHSDFPPFLVFIDSRKR